MYKRGILRAKSKFEKENVKSRGQAGPGLLCSAYRGGADGETGPGDVNPSGPFLGAASQQLSEINRHTNGQLLSSRL